MPISVAIIGSGPSAFYTADALLECGQDVRVDIIERLPAPFGLIRYGVAPDHQTTKNVSRAFDKTAREAPVSFFGHVEVGRDVSVSELKSMYDAVVVAMGAPHDRPLGIPGENKAGVVGSAAFVGWYNALPEFRDLNPGLNVKSVAVIGMGNVAIDVCRVLVKTRAEMAHTDIADYALDAIQAAPITDVYMFGRRGPVEAAFTNVELREMGKLDQAVPVVKAEHIPADSSAVADLSERDRRLKERNLATLREFTLLKADSKPKRVHFEFYSRPVEILGGAKAEGVRLERTRVENGQAIGTGEFFDIPCGLVVAAIGYRSGRLAGVPFDEKRCLVPNTEGRVEQGVYVVGWAMRGPTGVIASNRPDGQTVAKHIAADHAAGGKKPGRDALARLLTERKVRVCTYDDWKAIDAVETAAATKPSPRQKFARIEDMLKALGD